MAWSTPLTAVANATLTAAQWNASVRDNLLVSAVGLATTAGSHFAASAANTLAERILDRAFVTTSETTASTTYADLATVGPAATVTTGIWAITSLGVQMSNSTTASICYASVDITSATTSAAADSRALVWTGTANHAGRSTVTLLRGLNPGSNAFGTKYRVSANTGTFLNRDICILPF